MRIFILSMLPLVQSFVFAQTNMDLYRVSNSDISKKSEVKAGEPDGEIEKTYSITITVTHIRNRDGVIRFKFYDDDTPFPHKLGFLRVVIPKSELTGDSLKVTYSGFTSKNMAIALLDDENDNWELDKGWFLPTEGHAFSNYFHTALRRPVYRDFSFHLTGDKEVVMKMKYY